MESNIRYKETYTKQKHTDIENKFTGKPDMLQAMGSQRARHELATEQQHLKCSVL